MMYVFKTCPGQRALMFVVNTDQTSSLVDQAEHLLDTDEDAIVVTHNAGKSAYLVKDKASGDITYHPMLVRERHGRSRMRNVDTPEEALRIVQRLFCYPLPSPPSGRGQFVDRRFIFTLCQIGNETLPSSTISLYDSGFSM